MTVVVSRQDARAAGLKRYFTGKPCKRGHVAERTTSNGRCAICASIANAERIEERREYFRLKAAARRAKNPSRGSAYQRQYYWENRERVLESAREYRKRNPHLSRKHMAARRARLLKATPPWQTEADRAAIAAMYVEAARLTAETGVLHHVDHIVPLRGRNICGLHVPGNLQVIPANDNLKKSNRWTA